MLKNPPKSLLEKWLAEHHPGHEIEYTYFDETR
jgi:hypothetical protein